MGILARAEQIGDNHEQPGLKPADSNPKITDAAVPSRAGNQFIRNAESLAPADAHLPSVQLTGTEKPLSTLTQLGKAESVSGGIGAVGGATTMGLVGKAYGALAEVFLQPTNSLSLSVSNELALRTMGAGAARGGLIGLAIGAAAFGAYEIVKQSGEHPDRAPDLAALT